MVLCVVKNSKLTTEQKWRSLKAQTERAGMSVKEEKGKVVVTRKKRGKGK